jgi:hypothetical protein
MSSNTTTADRTALAAMLAPEDVRCGDYIAVLDEIVELPSWLWCDLLTDTGALRQIRCRADGGGVPLKVKAICLPFVFVKSPRQQPWTLDVRQYRLVRLDRSYARTVWKELQKPNAAAS